MRQGWRRLALAVGVLLLGFGGWQLGAAGYIHAKAWLSQVLLSRAWADTLAAAPQAEVADAALRRPWPWADTGPVARLRVPALGVDQVILAGASGRTLAFGPGHLDQTAAPGAVGHSVVSGHRDTHFAFLKDLAPAMKLEVQRPDGAWRSYRVRDSAVVDSRNARLSLDAERPALTLVTCWPFDTAEPGGPLRYAVFATASDGAAAGDGLDGLNGADGGNVGTVADYVPPRP